MGLFMACGRRGESNERASSGAVCGRRRQGQQRGVLECPERGGDGGGFKRLGERLAELVDALGVFLQRGAVLGRALDARDDLAVAVGEPAQPRGNPPRAAPAVGVKRKTK